MRVFIVPVLFVLGCSAIFVSPAGKNDGTFHAKSPFWVGGGGGGGGGDDSDTTFTIIDDTGTTTTTTTTTDDTGGTTSGTDCPFGDQGDSISLDSEYLVTDDGCDWGQSSFPGSVTLTCTGRGEFEMEDTGFVGTTVICTSSGMDFSCSLESSFYFSSYGTFTGKGKKASGSWSLSSDCTGAGEFSWQ